QAGHYGVFTDDDFHDYSCQCMNNPDTNRYSIILNSYPYYALSINPTTSEIIDKIGPKAPQSPLRPC
ncbi:MAG: hypothetical protein WCS01_08300, partial [bacterium]